MNFQVSADARPQVRTLLLFTLLSVVLWFIPFADYLTYPFRLFATFIHEGGHALAALLTGNSVHSLSVATDGSGLTYTTTGGFFSQLLVSSAGYVGAVAFGAALLVALRRVSARAALLGSAGLILALTLLFGLLAPVGSMATNTWAGIPFTLISGLIIAGGLLFVALRTSPRGATFFAGFLAVQCVINALLDLKTIFFLSTPFAGYTHSDAMNLAQLTGLPRIVWAAIWVVVSLLILSVALRAYAVSVESRAADVS
jgi:hypothetical protein